MDFHLRGTVRRPAENDKKQMYSVHLRLLDPSTTLRTCLLGISMFEKTKPIYPIEKKPNIFHRKEH